MQLSIFGIPLVGFTRSARVASGEVGVAREVRAPLAASREVQCSVGASPETASKVLYGRAFDTMLKRERESGGNIKG